MRRPLLGLAAPFAAGCLLSDRQGSAHEALLLLGLAAVLLAGACGCGARRTAAWALVWAGLALGTAAASVESLQLARGALARKLGEGAFDGRPVRAFGRIRGDAVLRDGRLGFVLDVVRVESDGGVADLAQEASGDPGGAREAGREAVA